MSRPRVRDERRSSRGCGPQHARTCLVASGGYPGGLSQGDLEMKSIHGGLFPGFAAVVVLEGCATIFTGTQDTLHFDANVPGVRLTLDGMYQGELPLTLDISRNFVGGRRFAAKFEREGYVTQQFE